MNDDDWDGLKEGAKTGLKTVGAGAGAINGLYWAGTVAAPMCTNPLTAPIGGLILLAGPVLGALFGWHAPGIAIGHGHHGKDS